MVDQRRLGLAATGVLVSALLGGALLNAESMEVVSFDADIAPMLKRDCLICHMPGDEQGDLSLYPDAYVRLTTVPSAQSPLLLVKPGSAEQSYLYHKVKGSQQASGGSGARMPFQRQPLDETQIERIRLWIEQGAKNN